MKRAGYAVLGYVLFVFGMLSMILSITGLGFKPLLFLDYFGNLLGFVLKLVVLLAGLIILYVARVSRE